MNWNWWGVFIPTWLHHSLLAFNWCANKAFAARLNKGINDHPENEVYVQVVLSSGGSKYFAEVGRFSALQLRTVVPYIFVFISIYPRIEGTILIAVTRGYAVNTSIAPLFRGKFSHRECRLRRDLCTTIALAVVAIPDQPNRHLITAGL